MAHAMNGDVSVDPRILWSLRSIARRERRLAADARRLTEPGLRKWREFAGHLHEGDFVSLLIENNATLSPLALRALAEPLSADMGIALIRAALEGEPKLLSSSIAIFLEAAAVAFGRPELGLARRAAFEPIRPQDQRILELPSTAARVAAMVAQPLATLETYVTYVVADEIDEFLVGLAMLEFDRNAMPSLIRVADLEAGMVRFPIAFSRAATLGGEERLLALFPQGIVQRAVIL